LLRVCQVILICAFEKLLVTLKDLCKLTGEWFFSPIHLAGKLQFEIYILLKFLLHIFEKNSLFCIVKNCKTTLSRSYQQWQCVYSMHCSYFLSTN